MKNKAVTCISLIVFVTAGCANRSHHSAPAVAVTPPASDDWTTEYEGIGSVRTSITNASHRALFLKIRQGAAVAAQVKLAENGTHDVKLAPGGYSTVMKLGANSYYRGPRFSIPTNTAHMMMTLQTASSSNLVRTTKEDFER